MSSPFDLTGELAVVSGASRGIGFAIARGLALAGADIIGVSASIQLQGSPLEAAVTSAGRRFSARRVNFADRVSVVALGEELAESGAGILVNNAGTIERAPAIDHGIEAWDRVIEVNLSSHFILSQALARPMLDRAHGRIIFTASLLSFQGGITVPGYAAAKSGIAGLTRALSNEWSAGGVTVNAIAPGYIATDNTRALRDDPARSTAILGRIPAGRWGESDEVAGAAVFFASRAAGYVSGAVLPVDGGWLGR